MATAPYPPICAAPWPSAPRALLPSASIRPAARRSKLAEPSTGHGSPNETTSPNATAPADSPAVDNPRDDARSSRGLSTAGESAGAVALGDVVSLGEPWPVDGSANFERRAAGRIDADGSNARGADGQGAAQIGGYGAVAIEFAGEVVQSRQGGRRDRHIQVGQPTLLGGEHERPPDGSVVAWWAVGSGSGSGSGCAGVQDVDAGMCRVGRIRPECCAIRTGGDRAAAQFVGGVRCAVGRIRLVRRLVRAESAVADV